MTLYWHSNTAGTHFSRKMHFAVWKSVLQTAVVIVMIHVSGAAECRPNEVTAGNIFILHFNSCNDCWRPLKFVEHFQTVSDFVLHI